MHRLQALRPKNAGRNIKIEHMQSEAACAASASRIGVLTLGTNAPPPNPLLAQKQRRGREYNRCQLLLQGRYIGWIVTRQLSFHATQSVDRYILVF